MALKTSRSIDDLFFECRKLGIPTARLNSKTDYILALRKYYLNKEYGDNIPKSLQLMLRIESPMLCKAWHTVKEADQNAIMGNPDVICEEKIDGCRCIVIFYRGDDGSMKFDCFSRNSSVGNFLPISYGRKILLDGVDLSKIRTQCVLDCEIVSTRSDVQVKTKSTKCRTQLNSTTAILSSDEEYALAAQKESPFKFYVFDVLWLKGVLDESSIDDGWLLNETLQFRRSMLEYIWPSLDDAKFPYEPVPSWMPAGTMRMHPEIITELRWKFFNNIVARGGEGIVLKNLKSTYNATGNRNTNWVKIKRTMRDSCKRDIDAFVVAGNPGEPTKGKADVIASLTVGVWLTDKDGSQYVHEIATVCNFTDEELQQMTVYDKRGQPTLADEYYGKVMTIDGQDISPKNRRFMHAKFIAWRDDRDSSTCDLDASILEQFTL